MFVWTKESIGWYQSAMIYTQYHKKVGGQLSEFFKPEDRVCDVGCGPGAYELELASKVKQITAVDVEQRVLDILSERLKEKHISNVLPVNLDWKLLEENSCDTLLACAFGTLEKDLYDFIKICRKRIVVVKRREIEKKAGFVTEYNRQNGADQDELFLKKAGIPYRLKTFEADFGQPLKDREDAERFIRHYKLKPEWQSMERYLEEYLIPGDASYQYYLPNHKEVHILAIEKTDVQAGGYEKI